MENDAQDDGVTRVAPRTETEQVLMEIWSSILKTQDICIYDHFLDLGGDSLLAVKCINRFKDIFSVEVPVDAFFVDSAHIAELARLIDEMRSGGARLSDHDTP